MEGAEVVCAVAGGFEEFAWDLEVCGADADVDVGFVEVVEEGGDYGVVSDGIQCGGREGDVRR